MKNTLLKIIYVLVLMLPISAQAENFNFSAYEPSTIETLEKALAAMQNELGAEGDKLLANLEKYQLNVTYTGKFRKLENKKYDLIKNWANVARIEESVVELYTQEVEVLYRGRAYYFPIQKQLIEFMKKELKVGESFSIYCVYIGGNTQGIVVLVGEFG